MKSTAQRTVGLAPSSSSPRQYREVYRKATWRSSITRYWTFTRRRSKQRRKRNGGRSSAALRRRRLQARATAISLGLLVCDPSRLPLPVLVRAASKPAADMYLPEAVLQEVVRLGERALQPLQDRWPYCADTGKVTEHRHRAIPAPGARPARLAGGRGEAPFSQCPVLAFVIERPRRSTLYQNSICLSCAIVRRSVQPIGARIHRFRALREREGAQPDYTPGFCTSPCTTGFCFTLHY